MPRSSNCARCASATAETLAKWLLVVLLPGALVLWSIAPKPYRVIEHPRKREVAVVLQGTPMYAVTVLTPAEVREWMAE